MNIRAALLLTGVAISCDPIGVSLSMESLVDEHIARTGLDYADCGTAEESWDCPTEMAPGYACLVEAFEACTPSRLRVRHATIDAGPVPSILLVEPRGDGCMVVEYQDHSGDRYKGDYGDVIHSECGTLTTEADCGYVYADQCEIIEEWGR